MRIFTLFLFAMMSSLFAFAQADQPNQKPAPSFVKLNQEKSVSEAPQVLAAYTNAGPETSFSESDTHVDELGMTHITYQQYHEGIVVDGYTYTAHVNNGIIQTITGAFAKTEGVSTTPAIGKAHGLSAALTELDLHQPMWESANAPHEYAKPEGELVIFFNPDTKTAELSYKYDIYTAEPLYRAWVYVSAQDGRVLFENLRIHHANDPIQAVSDYNGTVGITGNLSNGVYSLDQTVSGGGVETFSLNNGTNYGSASSVTDNGSPFDSDGTAVQAHYGAEQTWAYFNDEHGRNSYNGTGGRLLSYVHYSSNYVNAFWDGSRMTYGDGDGVNYGPLTSLDIAGHEMAHGVTEFSAGLVYRRESGALNESFSDIFGEMVEFKATGSNDWQMGTDIGIGGSGAIRSMDNPGAFGDPDTYGGNNWINPNCGTPTRSNDYCGVHSNSGVQNKWFYILAVGESGTNDIGNTYAVTGIGRTAAGAIAYRNLATYLSANSTYADARAGAIQAAIDLYGAGSVEEIATTDAWYAVGVGAAYNSGGGGPATCVGAAVDLTLVTDNYASETSWTLTNSAGVTIESGSGYSNNQTYTFNWTLATDDYTFTINDSYGDGICCSYGNGSYTVASAGTTIGTGGAFGSSANVPFCVDAGGSPPDTEAPSVPANVTASAITETTLTLSWSASTDNVGVTGYEVFVDGASIGTVAGTTANVTGLAAGTTYNFGVTASDAAGNTSAAGATSATTSNGGPAPDTEAPSVPSNVTASAITETTLTLSWNASSDNVGVTGYEVFIDGASAGVVTGTSANITGLTAGTAYTFGVTASDAEGNTSAAGSTTATTTGGGGGPTGELLASYFETGLDGWVDGGSDCYRYSGSRSYEGSRSMRLRDNSGTASSMTTSQTFDLTGASSVNIDFYFYAVSMESGEDFWVQYQEAGGAWQTVASYARGSSFNNNTFYSASVTMTDAEYNFSNGKFRFRCDASNNNDLIYIDQVTITAVAGTPFMGTPEVSTQSCTALYSMSFGEETAAADDTEELFTASISPNPARDYVDLQLSNPELVTSAQLVSTTGQFVRTLNLEEVTDHVDVSSLRPGLYVLLLQTTDGETQTLRFVKQ